MYYEWTGNTPIDENYINVSDGGHFDNLGLYEMLRRRCRKIVIIDGGCDPDLANSDLGKAIRMAKLDCEEGLRIVFRQMDISNLSDKDSNCVVAVADIFYGPKDDTPSGELFYVKPKRIPGLPPEVTSYAARNPSFPHQSTTDQWFGEEQFNAYVTLGEHLGNQYIKLEAPKK